MGRNESAIKCSLSSRPAGYLSYSGKILTFYTIAQVWVGGGYRFIALVPLLYMVIFSIVSGKQIPDDLDRPPIMPTRHGLWTLLHLFRYSTCIYHVYDPLGWLWVMRVLCRFQLEDMAQPIQLQDFHCLVSDYKSRKEYPGNFTWQRYMTDPVPLSGEFFMTHGDNMWIQCNCQNFQKDYNLNDEYEDIQCEYAGVVYYMDKA